MEIKFKKLHPFARTPRQANPGDAGFDLYVLTYEGKDRVMTYHTGIAVQIPEGYVGLLFSRSSVYRTDLRQTNCVGVIDSGYRGEIMVKFDIISMYPEVYRRGDKFCQLVIMPVPEVTYTEVEELDESVRGEGGYGSSDKKEAKRYHIDETE